MSDGYECSLSEAASPNCRHQPVYPYRPHPLRLPRRLKPYPIPDDLRECFSEQEREEDVRERVLSVRPTLGEPLCMENYFERFSSLLFVEELRREEDMRQFDMCSVSDNHVTVRWQSCNISALYWNVQ